MPMTIAAALQMPSVRGSVDEAVTGVSICFRPRSLRRARLALVEVNPGAGGCHSRRPPKAAESGRTVEGMRAEPEARVQDFGSWAWSSEKCIGFAPYVFHEGFVLHGILTRGLKFSPQALDEDQTLATFV